MWGVCVVLSFREAPPYLLLLEQSEQAEAPRLVFAVLFLTGLLSQFLQLVDLVMFIPPLPLCCAVAARLFKTRQSGKVR